jgi:predicted alpha-1,2-mannosidase
MSTGWVPDEVSGSSVSITLELSYDDWCIAQLAALVGDDTLHEDYRDRSRAFRHVFDADIGFMRPRGRDGAWRPEFDTMATHGQGFIEGNAWTYSLYVPHDVAALTELLGGPVSLGDYLDALFEMELSDEHIADTEDITRDGIIGNYVHGNEPGHHIAYLYNWSDRPWRTQSRVRAIMDEMYGRGVDGLCGNDDAGQMSAWYVFSALGFYPVCPGSTRYELGSPLVKNASLEFADGATLVVRAENQSGTNVYVQRVEIDGEPVDRRYVEHADLIDGGEIVFHMGPAPVDER